MFEIDNFPTIFENVEMMTSNRKNSAKISPTRRFFRISEKFSKEIPKNMKNLNLL